MNDLIEKLRKHPNHLDCLDAALALEQAISLLQRATTGDEDTSGKDPSKWMGDVYYWLNTWDKNEEEE